MKKWIVKEYVTANFGTLGGWSKKYYDSYEEAKANCPQWGIIEEIEINMEAKK